jgi:arylsulfatase A-like enzyme
VLLITWDTVRADHVGEPWTPTYNRMAERAVRFPEARTTAPITLAAHASMMTGEPPPIHGARDNGTWPMTEGLPTLAERYRDAGWTTGAFISASVLDSRYGIARGFSTYNDHIRPGKDRVVAHRPGAETVEHAIDWLVDKPSEQPVFLWVHLFDPHRPWDASTSPNTTDYQAAIGLADDATGRLLDAMEARGRLESSIIALTSDHGEGLGEHGEETHGFFAYDSTMRVPLMVWIGEDVSTHGPTTAQTVDGQASILDIGATLLAASGLEPIGRDSINLLSTDEIAPRSLSVETVTPALDFGCAPIFAVYDEAKRVWYDTPRPERYHLDSDPKQLVNRYRPEHASKAKTIFSRFPRHWPPTEDPMALAPEDREALEALGYITRSEAPKSHSSVDAKDMVGLFNLLTNTPDEPPLQLIVRADAMIKQHGIVPALMLFKAELLDALARPVDALQTVKDAATAHPTDRDLNGEYLQRRRALDDLERLATAIEDELAKNPSDLTAQRDLSLTYHRLQRFDEAEALYQRILRARPRADEVRIDMARMYASQQRYDVALSSLAPAMRRPDRSPAIDCMAGRLMKRGMGRAAEAEVLLKQCSQ